MMVKDIDFTIDQFKHIPNIEYVHFHVESCIGNEMRVIDKIKDINAKPVACINLATSFHSLDRLLQNDEIDGIMLMGIHPGVLIQESRPKNILNEHLNYFYVELHGKIFSKHDKTHQSKLFQLTNFQDEQVEVGLFLLLPNVLVVHVTEPKIRKQYQP